MVPVRLTHRPYLDACLASVAAQTAATDCELVVADDASGRAYAKEIDHAVGRVEGALDVKRVTLARQGGPAGARAAGVEASSGRYVLFLDSDDVLDVRMIEAVMPALHRGCSMAYTNEARVSADGGETLVWRDKRAYADLLARHAGTEFDPLIHATFVCHGQVVLRSVLDAVGGLRRDVEFGDEMDLPIRVAEHSGAEGLVLVPETLYRYRRHPASVVHDPAAWERVVACVERIVLEGAQRRGVGAVRAQRIGRAERPADVAHYALFDGAGRRMSAPWFDYDELRLAAIASS